MASNPEDMLRLVREAEHPRNRERYRALYAIGTKASNATQWAKATGRENETILGWIHQYNADGPDAVAYRHSGGRTPFLPRRRRLSLLYWSPVGETAWVPSSSPGLSARLNYFDAYNFTDGVCFVWEDGKCNGDTTLRFLDSLAAWLDEKKRQVVLILDGASYHRTQKVRDYAKHLGFESLALPGYSPDLNPIEGLWRWLREVVAQHYCHGSLDELRLDCQAFLTTLIKIRYKSSTGSGPTLTLILMSKNSGSHPELSIERLFEKHRIVFWYDDKHELRAEFNALALPGVEKIVLDNNQFGVKHRILRQETQRKFLLYHAGRRNIWTTGCSTCSLPMPSSPQTRPRSG